MTDKAISSVQLCKQHGCTVQHNTAWQLLFPLLTAHSPSVWMHLSNNTQAITGTKNPHPSCKILAQNSPKALKSPCLLPPPLAKEATDRMIGPISSDFLQENTVFEVNVKPS